MLEKYNRYQLLKIFLFNPTDSFRLRELSRLSKISPLSVMNYLKEFQKEDIVIFTKKRDIPFYSLNLDNSKVTLYKKIAIQYELENVGLIDYIWQEVSPEAIILYGSYAKGESTSESDIDLFVIGKEIKLNLEAFEKKLGKKVHILFEESKNIPSKLKNNLCNGIILKGYFKVLL